MLLDHAFRGEVFQDVRPARLGEAPAQVPVLEQPGDGPGAVAGVARCWPRGTGFSAVVRAGQLGPVAT